MKKILVSTIGNRDIQFGKEIINQLPSDIRPFLTENTETPTLVISKHRNDKNFLLRSKAVFEKYTECEPYIKYPLIQTAIDREGTPYKIILIATDQEPSFHLDTVYVAEMLSRKLIKDLGVPTQIQTISDAQNSQKVFSLFQSIINEYQDNYQIIIHTSGGLPNFRMSAFMASIFQEQVNVVNYIGQDAHEASMYRDYEKHTLYQIVENMLRNWNYSAVLALPVISDDVKEICRFAIARLALDVDKARELSASLSLQNGIPHKDDQIAIEKELIYSAYIKYHQKEYGDFLFRLFTFQDNMLVPHVQEILGGLFQYEPKTNHKTWVNLLEKEENKDILHYLQTSKIGSTPLNINEPNKLAYYKILHYCKKYSDRQNLTQKQFLVMKLYNKLSQLADLRNRIAHSYDGINESMIFEAAHISKIQDVTKRIDAYLEVDFEQLAPYKEVNEMILEHL